MKGWNGVTKKVIATSSLRPTLKSRRLLSSKPRSNFPFRFFLLHQYILSHLPVYHRKTTSYDSDEMFFSFSRESKPAKAGTSKAPHVSTFLGKAGIVGVEVSILAFEVANTIVRGSNLMQSLSEENIHVLKKEILHSQGVQLLVSTDMKELLTIAAADKREEFEIFSREVARFGNRCKDPQWHNLDRYFDKLDLYRVTYKKLREECEITMQELTHLAQNTSELYHEYHALYRIEEDYRRMLEEVESLHLPRKGDSLMILQSELKHKKKLVRNLKKKSLWSRSSAEIVEKLVDVVLFIRRAIAVAFEENAEYGKETYKKTKSLGVTGLALHYAILITQIDNIASRPTSLPPNMRDTLYIGLPASVKAGLRSCIQALGSIEVMTMPQIKAEMEKTLHWLVPVATNTTKAHQVFGWVGEWANSVNEFGKNTAGSNNIIRLQTLYHADKQKIDQYILHLVILLHRLISLVRYRDKVPKYTPTLTRSPPTSKGLLTNGQLQRGDISQEEKSLLEGVMKRRTVVPLLSKSEEFVMVKKKKQGEVLASSRSMGSSPGRDYKYANANMLDVLDGLGTTF